MTSASLPANQPKDRSYSRMLMEEISTCLGLRARRHDAEDAAFLQPARAFVAQQCAADFSGIVARADADHLKAFGMLVAAEPVGKERAHAVGDGLPVRAAVELD